MRTEISRALGARIPTARWLVSKAWTLCYPWIAPFVWNRKTPRTDARWGAGRDDYAVLADVFRELSVRSVLDLGCGSGRLFPLYAQHGIHAIGVDISGVALANARSRFPSVPTIRASLATLQWRSLPYVDLVVSNRVLQHLPRKYLNTVITGMTILADQVYINELSESDGRTETWSMVRHDYDRLFGAYGFVVKRTGR